jgi:hypothetical protein
MTGLPDELALAVRLSLLEAGDLAKARSAARASPPANSTGDFARSVIGWSVWDRPTPVRRITGGMRAL